jgi:hypothetical protein
MARFSENWANENDALFPKKIMLASTIAIVVLRIVSSFSLFKFVGWFTFLVTLAYSEISHSQINRCKFFFEEKVSKTGQKVLAIFHS